MMKNFLPSSTYYFQLVLCAHCTVLFFVVLYASKKNEPALLCDQGAMKWKVAFLTTRVSLN